MQVKSIAECSKGSILQYVQHSLSYRLSLRALFCLFLSGRFTQVLLYIYVVFLSLGFAQSRFQSLILTLEFPPLYHLRQL